MGNLSEDLWEMRANEIERGDCILIQKGGIGKFLASKFVAPSIISSSSSSNFHSLEFDVNFSLIILIYTNVYG